MSGAELTGKKTELWKTILFHGSFAFMFVMAVAFFKESLYADPAYYIYQTIDTGFFVTPHQRIVLAISEILPLIFFYCGSSLKTILIVYSVGHVLFYYSLFLIALYKFKSEGGAIAIILLQVVGQTWLYFAPMLEICYGAALLVIFKLILDGRPETEDRSGKRSSSVFRLPSSVLALIALEILILTSHPENFVVFFFVIGYDILKNGFRKYPHVILLLVFIGLVIFKFFTFSDYEGGKIHYMTDLNQNHQYENLLNSGYMHDVWKIFWQQYLDLLILLSVVCFCFIYTKKYKLLGFTLATIVGLVALINATNYARVFSRYNESLYYPLVTIIIVVFMFEAFQTYRPGIRNAFIIVFAVIFITRFNKIEKQGEYLGYRVFQLEEFIRQAHQQKVTKGVINLKNAEKDRWALNWSYPVECLLLSAIKGADSTVSIITDEDMAERDTSISLNPGKVMTRPWDISEQAKMLSYFKLKDENYRLLNTIDSITNPEEFSGKINLEIDQHKFLVFYERLFLIVKIRNQSGHLLTSSPVDKNYFKVSCTASDNNLETTVPLDIDVSSDYSQVIACPIPYFPAKADVNITLIWMGKEVASTKEKIKLN